MIALADRATSEGNADQAASYLVEAGEGCAPSAAGKRRSARIESSPPRRAKDDHYAAWTEAARQAGMASLVLERSPHRRAGTSKPGDALRLAEPRKRCFWWIPATRWPRISSARSAAPCPGIDVRVNNLLEQLHESVVVADGATGTALYERGVFINQSFDALCLGRPELVSEIHREYLRRAPSCSETNTFGANRARLAGHGLEEQVREINLAAVRLAREAAGTWCGSGGRWVRWASPVRSPGSSAPADLERISPSRPRPSSTPVSMSSSSRRSPG